MGDGASCRRKARSSREAVLPKPTHINEAGSYALRETPGRLLSPGFN